MSDVIVFSGGAAQGLVARLADEFTQESGATVRGTFGAVGMMKDKLLQGEACDLLILSHKLITELAESGHVDASSVTPIGAVQTGIAVKAGEAKPPVDSPQALRQALLAASAVYFPDPHKATAGIHFMGVLKALGIDQELAQKLHPFPNGATAMREMAAATTPGAIGCTQVSEILFAAGVELVASLPEAYALATTYTAAISSQAREPALAAKLIDTLIRPAAAEARRAAGVE